MPQQHVSARQLKRLLPGSMRAHQDLVRACIDYLALRRIPAVPISTTGIPVPHPRGGFELRANRAQAGLSDVLACVPRRFPLPHLHPAGARVWQGPARYVGQLVLLEVKTGRARRTPEQRALQARFAAAGALCLVVRSIDDLIGLERL